MGGCVADKTREDDEERGRREREEREREKERCERRGSSCPNTSEWGRPLPRLGPTRRTDTILTSSSHARSPSGCTSSLMLQNWSFLSVARFEGPSPIKAFHFVGLHRSKGEKAMQRWMHLAASVATPPSALFNSQLVRLIMRQRRDSPATRSVIRTVATSPSPPPTPPPMMEPRNVGPFGSHLSIIAISLKKVERRATGADLDLATAKEGIVERKGGSGRRGLGKLDIRVPSSHRRQLSTSFGKATTYPFGWPVNLSQRMVMRLTGPHDAKCA